ncbi:6432_t:CDS:2 [Gigaspora margarita]|uniref:6432_t:CDS:1 n=1 Tax=Gigaspora margarita TaxID=4874 RepID=A0ABN7UZ63_GIGMA|nr:6432_t:CDS:2 [Gigaspora margarita]
MDYEELKICEEISIFENYEIIAPLYLTIPNDKTSKVYFQLIDDTPIEFYKFYYDSNLYYANFIKAEFVKFQNVTSFDRYENTIEADKIEYIMYYPDGLFYWDYIEKGFYCEFGTYIKYFILTNTYIFVDSKSTHTLERKYKVKYKFGKILKESDEQKESDLIKLTLQYSYKATNYSTTINLKQVIYNKSDDKFKAKKGTIEYIVTRNNNKIEKKWHKMKNLTIEFSKTFIFLRLK